MTQNKLKKKIHHKTKAKPLQCMAFVCVIFFPESNWHIFYIPNCLVVIYIYCIVLYYNLHQSPCKKWCYRVFLPLMLPVSPYWILGHDGSLWIFFHFRCWSYCLKFHRIVWPIIGMTLALIKTCPVLSCLVPFVRQTWVQSGISSGACLGNLVLSSLSLCHRHLSWPDPTIIFLPKYLPIHRRQEKNQARDR